MDADDAVAFDDHLLGIVLGMLRPVGVTVAPVRVDAQDDVAGMGQGIADDRVAEKDVGIGADEAAVHERFGMEQREENVVVLPVGVVGEGELGIIPADLLDLVAADEDLALAKTGAIE